MSSIMAGTNTYLPLVHVDFGTCGTLPYSISGVVVEEDLRIINRANAACAWSCDIVVRDPPPLLVARANFTPALAFEAVQVLASAGTFQGDDVRFVAILNSPFLFVAAIAFVLDDNARRAVVLLVC